MAQGRPNRIEKSQGSVSVTMASRKRENTGMKRTYRKKLLPGDVEFRYLLPSAFVDMESLSPAVLGLNYHPLQV